MTKQVYLIYDVIAKQVASALIIADNDDTIKRDLADAKLTDTMTNHPEDFDLIHVGELDTEVATLVPVNEITAHLGAIVRKGETVNG